MVVVCIIEFSKMLLIYKLKISDSYLKTIKICVFKDTGEDTMSVKTSSTRIENLQTQTTTNLVVERREIAAVIRNR